MSWVLISLINEKSNHQADIQKMSLFFILFDVKSKLIFKKND